MRRKVITVMHTCILPGWMLLLSLTLQGQQKTIDVIKYNRPIEGLDEPDTVLIQMGRQIMRNHKLDSEVFAHAVKVFGRQRTLEIALAIGDYVMAGIMLTAADQQLLARSGAHDISPGSTRGRD